ncbi:MAG: FkbM family methyltransferase [Acidimicrobiales bacterium]
MNVVYVAGMHKSGTSLLRNLLVEMNGIGGHGFELHPYEAVGAAVTYPLRRRRAVPAMGAVEAMRRVEAEARSAALTADRYGGGIPTVPELRGLGDAVRRASEIDWPHDQAHRVDRVVDLAGAALTVGDGSRDGLEWVVEKSVENLEFVADQLAATPSARVVHIVRHPAAVLAALRRFHYLVCDRPGCIRCRVKFVNRVRAVWWARRHGNALRRRAPDTSIRIRYEDLVADPPRVITRIGWALGLRPLIDEAGVARAVERVEVTNSSVETVGPGISASRSAAWTNEASLGELLAAYALVATDPMADYPASEIRRAIGQRVALGVRRRPALPPESVGLLRRRPREGDTTVLRTVVARLNPRRDVDLAATGLAPWRFVARGARVAVTPRRWMLPARFPNGLMIKGYNRPGYGGRGIYMFRDRVEPELALFEAVLDEGDWAVDVGSCVGTYALNAAMRVGPTGAVIAVDPSPAAMAVLADNAASNGLDNVVRVCAAASDVGGFDSFDESNHRPDARGLVADGVGGATMGSLVPVVTIDDLVAAIGTVKRIRVMKIDAEGADDRVVRGARQTIETWKPVLVVEQAVRAVVPLPGYEAWACPTSRNHVWIHESDTDGRATAARLGFDRV